MTGSRLRRWFQTARYEDARWPLWRWDQNIRYILKSFVHRDTPWTEADRAHWARNAAFLSGYRHREGQVRLVAGGDWMWIRSGWATAMSPAIRARIAAADAALFNLESPVVPERPVPRLVAETLRYNCPPEYLDGWDAGGPCFASLCNNHALDQGLDGLIRTRQTVAERGLLPIGGARPADAVASAEVAGRRVSAFGFTFGVNHPGAPPGIPLANLGTGSADALAPLVAEARQQGDVVVALAHWGYEYEYWPHQRLREAAYRLVELGVDLVVGTSPHVLQPVELVSVGGALPEAPVQVEGSPRVAGIAWSLGNLCSVIPTLPCRVGALLEIALDSGGVCGLRAIPTLCGRGVGSGRGWLDAGVVTLAEHPASPERDRAWQHARTILGEHLEAPWSSER